MVVQIHRRVPKLVAEAINDVGEFKGKGERRRCNFDIPSEMYVRYVKRLGTTIRAPRVLFGSAVR